MSEISLRPAGTMMFRLIVDLICGGSGVMDAYPAVRDMLKQSSRHLLGPWPRLTDDRAPPGVLYSCAVLWRSAQEYPGAILECDACRNPLQIGGVAPPALPGDRDFEFTGIFGRSVFR